MASPFSSFASAAQTSKPEPLHDFDKPVTDVYRTGTISDVGLMVGDIMSPGKGSLSNLWSNLWSVPSRRISNTGAAAAAVVAAAASTEGSTTTSKVDLPQQQHNFNIPASSGNGASDGSSWSKWLLGSK